MRKFWLVTALLACLAAVGTVIVAPGRIDRVEMASETDGVHQDDHKVLGFLPYSTTKSDPSLHVTDDAFRRIQAAGIRNLPEAKTQQASYPVSRVFWPGHKTAYDIPFDLKKRTPKDATDFYARQLKSPKRWALGGGDGVVGLCPDGKTRLTFTVMKSIGGDQGRLTFEEVR